MSVVRGYFKRICREEGGNHHWRYMGLGLYFGDVGEVIILFFTVLFIFGLIYFNLTRLQCVNEVCL